MTNIFVGEAMTGLFMLTLFGLGRSLPVWIIFAAMGSITPVFVNGSSQAIWQSKVALDLQGRVFSARRMIAWITDPITPLLAEALADYVTEPGMQAGGLLAKHLRLAGRHGARLGDGIAILLRRHWLYAGRPGGLSLLPGGAQPGRPAARPRPIGES
ncbi:MAG: hypothetical protein MZU84_06685 [Sphingobacterium sp.]|nr:hypothetical protein [Sphingobacterium sp.]